MKFKIQFLRDAKKDLERLEHKIAKRIVKVLENLSLNPFQQKAIKIKGEKDIFRIRVGKYRILYKIYANKKTLLVIRIDKRSRVYRDL